jgi:hypothetical protein
MSIPIAVFVQKNAAWMAAPRASGVGMAELLPAASATITK